MLKNKWQHKFCIKNNNNVKTRLCTDYKGVRVFEVKNVDKV